MPICAGDLVEHNGCGETVKVLSPDTVNFLSQSAVTARRARTVSFRGDRLAVVPIELDSARARRLREELPEALYESGRSQVSVRVPKEGEERFPSVVRAADTLLSVVREAA